MTDVFASLTGTGDLMLAAPRFVPLIGVSVTTIPPGAAKMDATSPQRLMKVGWIAPGRLGSDPSWPASLFFADAKWIDFERELITYPAPGIYCDRIRYRIEPGGVATIYVNDTGVPAVPNSLLQPWDRSPSLVALNYNGFMTGTVAAATSFTYTVPTGKIFMLSYARVQVTRRTVATAPTAAEVVIYVGSLAIVRVTATGAVLGQVFQDELSAGPVFLPAGAVITGQYLSNMTDGQLLYDFTLGGNLFNV